MGRTHSISPKGKTLDQWVEVLRTKFSVQLEKELILKFVYFLLAPQGLPRYTLAYSRGPGLLPRCGGRASSHCRGFSSWRVGSRGTGSVVVARGLQGVRSGGTQAQLPRSTWDLPGSGVETMSPLLAEFLTTGTPGSPRKELSNSQNHLKKKCSGRSILFIKTIWAEAG